MTSFKREVIRRLQVILSSSSQYLFNKIAERRDTVTKERFLTRRWNNWLLLGMGLPTLVYAVVFLSTSVLSDLAGFIGMAVIGAVYPLTV